MANPSGWTITPPANTGGWEITQPHQVGGWSIAPPSGPSLLGRIENAALAVPREIGAEIKKQKAAIARRQNIASRMFGTPAQRASVTPAERAAEREQVVGTASGLAGTQDLAAGPISEAAGAVAKDLVPAVRTAEGLKVGKVGDNHDTIVPNAPEKDRGFVRQSEPTKFLSRKQAAKLTPEVAGTAPLGKGKPESLSSEDLNAAQGLPQRKPIAEEGPLAKAPTPEKPKEFTDQLFQLEGRRIGTAMEARRTIRDLPKDLTPEDYERVYHYEESHIQRPLAGAPEKVDLNPRQQKLYDDFVKPISTRADAAFKTLQESGIDVPDELKRQVVEFGRPGYTPRYAAGIGRSFPEALDRFINDIRTRWRGGAPTRSMRQTVEAQKARRFYIATSPEGESRVVHVGRNGDVVAFDGEKAVPFGEFGKFQKLGPGTRIKVGDETWNLEDATTQEIEKVARTTYHKNVMVNRLDNLAKVESAADNARYIKEMTQSPEWSNISVDAESPDTPTVRSGMAQRPYRTPKLMQFRKWKVDPRVADALDDFANTRIDSADSLMRGLNFVGHIMNAVMFTNPLPHFLNEANHFIMARGLFGNIYRFPSTVTSILRGLHDVWEISPDYIKATKLGAPLPYSRWLADDLHTALLREFARKNLSGVGRLARLGGWADTRDMLKGLATASNRAMWFASDVMRMSRLRQIVLNQKVDMPTAITQMEKEMPSYRVPTTVLGSRIVREFFADPAVGRFGRYQFNVLEWFYNQMKDAAGKGSLPGDARRAYDRLAALAMWGVFVMPLLDKFAQWATGNKDASFYAPGLSKEIQLAKNIYENKRAMWDAVSANLTLGIPVSLLNEINSGRYSWSGGPIIRDPDVRAGRWKQVMRDALRFVVNMTATPGALMFGGTSQRGQAAWQAVNIKSPTEQSVERQRKWHITYGKESARRAARQQNQRQ